MEVGIFPIDECITCAAYRKKQDYLETEKLRLLSKVAKSTVQLGIDRLQEQWSIHLQYHEKTFFPTFFPKAEENKEGIP